MMKIYIKTLLIFIITCGIGVVLRMVVQLLIEQKYNEVFYKSYLLISFIIVILFLVKDRSVFFQKPKLNQSFWLLALILLAMFGINNYMMVIYSDNQYYANTIKSALMLNFITYIISSTAEEVVYRGFVQTYINENTVSNLSRVSKGNIVATILFFLSHIAFFTVMDSLFAVTSLINVVAFSLAAGYLLDKTKNIFVPIVVHIVINILHIVIQVNG